MNKRNTNGFIGIVNNDGSVDSIYCKYENYIGWTGRLLSNCYSTERQVRDLVALGDLIVLYSDTDITITLAQEEKTPIYIRRDEDLHDFFNAARNATIEFCYLFRGNKWKYTELQEGGEYPALQELEPIVEQDFSNVEQMEKKFHASF